MERQTMGEEFREYHEAATGETFDLSAPIAVKVVEAVHVEEFPATTLNTGQVALGLAGKPVKIVGRRVGRVSLSVKNKTDAAARVWIGGVDQLSKTFGYELDPSEQMAFQMNGDLYAVSDTDNPTGSIHWMTEDRDG